LIVGAHGDVNHSDHPEGKSYVVFGKKDNTNAVNLPVSKGSDPKAPITKSSKPSPLTSPAEETALPL
jgi:hypothetical protein